MKKMEVSVEVYNEIAEFWNAKEAYDFYEKRDVAGYLSAEKRMTDSARKLLEFGKAFHSPIPKLDDIKIKTD